MHKKSFVHILLVFTLAGITAFINGCSPAKSESQGTTIKPVKLYTMPNISANSYDSFLAEVDAGNRSQLSFQVPGMIQHLAVRDGQHISKGQLLGNLDPTDYQLAVDASQSQFDLADTRYKRDKQLYNKKLISTDMLDQSETAYKAAQANLEEAKTDLRYTQLKAPFSGLVSITFVKAHQFVAAKMPILNIINNDQLDISISIPVPYVDAIGINALKERQFSVIFDLYNDIKVPAKFKEMSTQPDAETNSYKTTVTIKRPNPLNILTGMTGQILISNNAINVPIRLPNDAWIYKLASEGKVWRVNPENNTVYAIKVELNENGAIINGLASGDMIVTAGAQDLAEGQVVRAWKREGGI